MKAKPYYQVKSGGYQTSKDYAHLKELLDAGQYVVCFVDFDMSKDMAYKFQDICLASKKQYEYDFAVRGISYLSFNFKWDTDFESLCKCYGVEFLEPTKK